jgi:hypothetical protein
VILCSGFTGFLASTATAKMSTTCGEDEEFGMCIAKCGLHCGWSSGSPTAGPEAPLERRAKGSSYYQPDEGASER